MNGDGFAVKTTIAQMGSVARTQLKAQQVHNTGPEHAKKPGEKESRVEKVRETEEAQKSKVDPDKNKDDGRRHPSHHEAEDAESALRNDLDQRSESGEEIGLRLDIKA